MRLAANFFKQKGSKKEIKLQVCNRSLSEKFLKDFGMIGIQKLYL